ncbi:alpha-N-acetylgalactosaminide alpha-2,6-sialyltransferase 2 [Chanos chanos]|uniref:alpha-N-acetylgalactosaminide alpha-2,6-sialyltransferase n=1 Tax=Chanos chanos TaxID=29144 RepID=A0A6J2VFW1_CHACN|nr:alpha-N-acetylgalactosaminide alpha-2,6-sialyltransferase 2-like [Chanos chanos]
MATLVLQRKLLFLFLTVTGVLSVYVLVVTRQIEVPWHMMEFIHFNQTSTSYGSKNTEGFLRRYETFQPSDATENVPTVMPRTTSKVTTAPQRKISPTPKTQARPNQPVKPTEPDFIGDRYATDDTPPQTNCPDSIRKKVVHTQFAEKFLGHIPVLQWAKHATPEEYKRLHRYSGAHGWGNLDYKTLSDSLSIMNTPANRFMFDDWEHRANRSKCIRCAVVGNGGILHNSRKGLEIDQHDYVFRTNGAVIIGFEEDVGSRTSFYTFSTNTLRNSMNSYAGAGYNGPPQSEETRYVFLPDHDRDYILMRAASTHTPVDRGPERSKNPPTYFGEKVTVEKFKMYHPDFIRYLRNRFLHSSILNTSYRNIYRPSTGATMLLAALHTCDQVSAYGFMTPDYNKYSDHYYDKSQHPVRFYANHDLRMEMLLWQQLHKAGLIRLYMRQ